MQLLKDGVLATLIFFNFVVTIVSFLVIYEAVTLDKSPEDKQVERINTYGYILAASIGLNFIAWLVTVFKKSRSD